MVCIHAICAIGFRRQPRSTILGQTILGPVTHHLPAQPHPRHSSQNQHPKSKMPNHLRLILQIHLLTIPLFTLFY
jgi:hypothetical protein